MNSKLQRLPDSELVIMKLLWEKGEAMPSAEIYEKLADQKEWKITTVLTLLSRLVEKGFVGTVRQGRGYLYSPLIEERDYLSLETGNLLKFLHKGSLKSLMATLCESGGVSEEEIDELMKWLKERGKENA